MSLVGRRLPDAIDGHFPLEWSKMESGDYWKILNNHGEPLVSNEPGNLTGGVWGILAPGPDSDKKMYARLTLHTVREHEDGTISVLPGDGSSNSILVQRHADEVWHGYIYAGVWQE